MTLNLDEIYKELEKEINRLKQGGSEFDLRYAFGKVLEKIANNHVFYERSRVDMIVLDVIIETKNYGLLSRKHEHIKAIENLENKMKRLNLPYGLLIDFKNVEIYELESGDVNLSYKGEFDFLAFKKIVELILSRKDLKANRLLSEQRLYIDFGDFQDFVKALYKMLEKSLLNVSKTYLLYSEWLKLFKLSEVTHREYVNQRRQVLERILGDEVNESNEYKLLFCLHTYIAIVVKFLTYNFLSRLKNIARPSKFDNIGDMKEFCNSIESGRIFRTLGVTNFCQFDFFMWYLEVDWNTEFFKGLNLLYQKAICYTHNPKSIEEGYTFADMIKSFYEKVVPREVRHSFGEYYTPSFIANYMVKEATKNLYPCYKAIDPTCGSGTFLVNLLVDKIYGKKIKNPLELRTQVVGMDLNPIAVVLARFNYLLTILHLLDENLTDYEIPVYVGDASYTPTIEEIDGVKCIKYKYYFPKDSKVDFGPIIFPVDFVKRQEFSVILNDVEAMVMKREPHENISTKLVEEIKKVCQLPVRVEVLIRDLVKRVVEYHKQNLNTIWLFIFMNYLKTFTLGPFDLIIGNPPWVRWAVLPEEYRNKIKATLRKEGIFSRDTNYGGVDLNICALIAYRTISTLAQNNGYLFFIFPKGILKNKSYEGFRTWDFETKKAIPVRVYFPKKKFFEGEEPILLLLQVYSSEKHTLF